MITIHLLGNSEITQDGNPLRISRVAVRTLLFYLACNPKGVSRINLINTLWPESRQAPRRLTEALSKLRAELIFDNTILVENDLIRLNSALIWVDLWEFERLFDRIQRAAIQTPEDAPLPAATAQDLNDALRLWRSYTLLDGCVLIDSPELDHFLAELRPSLENSLIYVLRRLGRHAFASGDLAEAIRLGEESLKIDPVHPELNYFLMQALLRAGRTRTAMERYERMRDYYDPHDQTLQFFQPLLEKINGNILAPEQHLTLQRVTWSDWKVSNAAFVGRRHALSRLEKVLHRGGAAALIGESGAGKTRLVHEFYQSLRPRPRVFLARGHRGEHNQSFHPLVESMRLSIHKEDWQHMDRVWAACLAYLIPEIREYRSDLPVLESTSLENSRQMLFESIRQIVLTMTSPHKGLFFLDDAQWSDLATLETFSYLLERDSFKDHGLLLLNIRPEEPNPALQTFLHKHELQDLEIISIDPFTVEEVSELAQMITGTQLAPPLVQRLNSETGGNALFLVETLRELSNCCLDELENVGRLPITQNMRALVQERLSLLDPNDRILVETAAVLGNEFKIGLLETCCEMEDVQVVHRLERLNHLNLVQPVVGLIPDRYRFVHQKTREIILGELSPVRQRWLHRRVARVLEKLDVHPAQLAQHYHQAGDALLAFRQWVKTAEYDLHLFATQDALEAFAQAEPLIAELTLSLTEEEINTFYVAWGELAANSGQLEQSAQIFQRQLSLGEQRHNATLMGCALSGLAYVNILTSHPMESMEYIGKSLFYLTQTRDVEQILKAYTRQGLLLVYSNRFREARQVMEIAMEFKSASSDPEPGSVTADAQNQLSMIYSVVGLPVKAAEISTQALIASRQAQYGVGVIYSLMGLVIASHVQGNYTACCDYAREVIRLANINKDVRLGAVAQCYYAQALAALGECDQALAQAQQALEAGERGKYPEVLGGAYNALGDIYLYLLDFTQASQYYQAGIAAQPYGAHNMDNQLRWLITALMMDATPGNSLISLGQFIEQAERVGMEANALNGKMGMAIAQANLGQVTQAQDLAKQLEPEIAARSVYTLEILQEWLEAELALQGCALERARDHAILMLEKAKKQKAVFLQLCAGYLLKRAGVAQAMSPLLDSIQTCSCRAELVPAVKRFRKRMELIL